VCCINTSAIIHGVCCINQYLVVLHQDPLLVQVIVAVVFHLVRRERQAGPGGWVPSAESGRVPIAESGWVPSAESGWVPSAESGWVPSAESGRVPSAESGWVPSAESENNTSQ
jgi:hypothetical protein